MRNDSPLRFTSVPIAVALLVSVLSAPAPAALSLHYTGDLTGGSGSTFQDISGRDNHGTQVGTNQTTTAAIGSNALKINGSTTRVEIPDAQAGDFDKAFDAFSIALWLSPLANENNRNRWLAGKMGGGGNRGWQLGRNTSETLGFVYFDGPSGASQSLISSSTVPADQFTHAAVTFAAEDAVRIYLNGMLDAEVDSGVLASLNGSNSSALQIGNRGDSLSNSSSGSTGSTLDDVGIWDQSLSGQRIAAIHAMGLFEDLNLQHGGVDDLLTAFGNETLATINGNPWSYTSGLTGPMGATGGSAGEIGAFVVLDGSGNGMTLVPEPGSVLLLLSALACGLLWRRRGKA